MLTSVEIQKSKKGWTVKVQWGMLTIIHGPYRWRWMARFVAWLENNQH